MKNGIVIPCYNEADRLKLSEFQNFIDNNEEYTLCFVNDGSKDDTLNQLEEFKLGQEDRVIVYNMPQNGGKAEAVRNGVKCLLNTTKVNNVGFIDADLATGFEDYQALVNQLENNLGISAVVGSRKLDDSIDMERSKLRSLASNMIGMIIKKIVGLDIKDTQCGAKVFERNIASIVFEDAFLSRWLFDVEIFIRLRSRLGVSAMNQIKEMALSKWEEVEGSKISLKDSLNFPLQLAKIAYQYHIAASFNMPSVSNLESVQMRRINSAVQRAA